MKMHLRYTSLFPLFLALLLSAPLSGQTDRNIVVEHFTNTRCPICGNRNPGLFDNLAQQGDNVLQISYQESPWVPLARYHLEDMRLGLSWYDGTHSVWHRQ